MTGEIICSLHARDMLTDNRHRPDVATKHVSRYCKYSLYDEGKLTIFILRIIICIVSAICCCVVLLHHIKSNLSKVKTTNETTTIQYSISIYYLISSTPVSRWKTRHSTAPPTPPKITRIGRRRKDTVPSSLLYPSRSYFPCIRVVILAAALIFIMVRWDRQTLRHPPHPRPSWVRVPQH